MTKGTMFTIISNPTVIAIAMAVMTASVFVAMARVSTSGGRKLKRARLPSDAWLSQGAFFSLEAMVDTFFPTINISGKKKIDVKNLASTLGIFADGKEGLNDVEVKRVEKFLAAGAQEYGTAVHVMNALKTCCSKTDQSTLGIVLYLLCTTFGSFLLTGFPVPFYVTHFASSPPIFINSTNIL